MNLFCRIACLLFLLTGALTQDDIDLSDILDDDTPKPKAADPPKKKVDVGFDLSDPLEDDHPPLVTSKPAKPAAVVPPKSVPDIDLADILDDDVPKRKAKDYFSEFDLLNVSGDYHIPLVSHKPTKPPKSGGGEFGQDVGVFLSTECQGEIMRKLNALLEIENKQMRMLQQMASGNK